MKTKAQQNKSANKNKYKIATIKKNGNINYLWDIEEEEIHRIKEAFNKFNLKDNKNTGILYIGVFGIKNKKKYTIGKKYHFLDEIFIRVLKDNPKLMPEIFFKMFEVESKKVINFLSNKSNLLEDISVILKMPKVIFIKALFK